LSRCDKQDERLGAPGAFNRLVLGRILYEDFSKIAVAQNSPASLHFSPAFGRNAQGCVYFAALGRRARRNV